MTLFQTCILGAIACLIIVTLAHSIFGETRLLQPLFKYRGNRVLESKLARMVLRFAWHLTSVMWIMMAVFLYRIGFSPAEELRPTILVTIGLGFLVVGLFDLILSRAKHIGWPPLVAIGILCLLAHETTMGFKL